MTLKADILRILNGLKVPAFVVDKDGKVLHSNSEGELLQVQGHRLRNIGEIFTPECAGRVKNRLAECIGYLNSSTLKSMDTAAAIKELNGKSEAEVSFTAFESEDSLSYAVCTLKFVHMEKKPEKFEFSFSPGEFNEIIEDDALIKIFEEIKSSFPFTFLGKNRLQNEINKLDEFFWLKDSDGKYLLVNLLFSQFLGLKPNQIEGKHETEFFPKHMTEMLLAVDKYIKDTANMVIRNGFPLYQLNGETARVVEVPLCDLDNKVIAVMGFSQKSYSQAPGGKFSPELLFESAIGLMPATVIIADKDGIVKSKSGELAALKTSEVYPGVTLKSILPPEICFEADSFMHDEALDTLELKKKVTSGAKAIPFVFHLRKIYNCRGKLEGFLLFVEEEHSLSANSNTIGNNEKMYEILMQTSPEPMFIYDIENLRFLDVNQAALQVYGYSMHEFLQMDLTDLYAPEDIQTLLDSSNSRNKEGVFTGPWRHRKKDGSSLLVEISKSAFDFQGKKAHFNIVKDVTQKAELEKNSQFFNAAFNTVSDPIFITDPEGFITKVNDSVTSLLGYSRTEMDMRPFLTLATDSYRTEINTSIFYSKSKVPVSLEVELKKSDGSAVEAKLVALPVLGYDGQVSSFSVVAKIKQKAQSEVGIYNAEDSRQARVKPFEDSSSPVKKSASGSIDPGFLSSMFHEILTPMNVILGFIQELTENMESPTQEQKESIDIINQNRAILMQTMDSVLEYSHIEQNRVEITPQRVFFTEVVDNLQKDLSRLMAESKILFNYGKISTSLSFETDRQRLESFLAMFIKMAMRITREGNIFLSAYQYDDQHCLISLKDRRASISPYLLENIALLFTADEDKIKKDFGISRLTLRLVRRLMALLHGKIEVVKRSGEPAEFGFLFPLVFQNNGLEPEGALDVEEEKGSPEPLRSQPDYEESRSRTSQAKEDEMDIIEDGEIAADLKHALREEEPVKMFEPQIPKKETTAPPASGAEATVTAKPEEKPIPSSPEFDLSRLQCLYVEDQIDSQILFKVQMKDLKKVDSVASFESALPLLEENKYDFIIMDINLQGEYNGLDALRIIRRMPGYRNIPVIAVTAYILAGDKEKFIAAGFNGFISKPVMRDKVMDALKKII
ncbi:MAG: PAS domain S-box protein [Ignavibacteria bacterium]|jgi:PAS domain S-box-containing protein|nr:PAS domain S-box protein [Ignavibacteria bacterium]MCU7503876.1 PAS domain S-box protein [Ignavibacteria bacterium]MCU7515903.1 PAS domain S-box protein [Ignavibacteria bacterium]